MKFSDGRTYVKYERFAWNILDGEMGKIREEELYRLDFPDNERYGMWAFRKVKN